MFKRGELGILWPFYLSRFIDASFSLISAYAILYLLDLGFSFFQVSIIFALSPIMSVIFEIPTGAIADIYGRKVSVFLSYLASGIIMLLIPLSSNFYYLAFLFAIWGITQTLSTGAYTAWVIDSLKQKRKSELIDYYYSHDTSLANIGVVVAPLLAALVVTYLNMGYLFTIQGITVLISGCVLLIAKEKFKKNHSHIKELFNQTIKQTKKSIRYGVDHPVIFKILLSSLFLMFVIGASGFLWQPYLKTFNIPLAYFGYVTSIAGFLSIFVPLITHHFSKKFTKVTKYLLILIIAFIISLASIYFISNEYLAMMIVVILYVAIMFIAPIEEPFFQRFVPNRMRATLGSFKSTTSQIGFALSTIIIGLVADLIGPKYSLVSLSFVLLPSLYYYLKIGKLGH
jgi:MFS family permease|tara:strand:- start:219 stop:1415 length:1197 start_codon:yes stop_codon:yes gene_type:complete